MMMNTAFSTIALFLAVVVGISADDSTTTRVIDRRRRLRVDGSTPCLTEISCRSRFTDLYNAGVVTGYFYSDSAVAVGGVVTTKGCIIKGENVYYTLGTEEEMVAPVRGTKKTRLYCLPEKEVKLSLDMSFSMLLSLPMPGTKASKPFIEAAELSLNLPEELSMSYMSMPLGAKASKPNRFIETAEYSLSMSDVSMSMMSKPEGTKALKLPSELSMSMSMSLLVTKGMSTPLQETKGVATKKQQEKVMPKEKSLPIKVSATSMPMNMPDMSMSFAADSSMSMLEMSMLSVPLIETSQVDMSMPIDLSMSISMPSIQLSEMSMAMMSSMPDLIQLEVDMDTTTTTTGEEEEEKEGFIENIKDETTGFFENATDTASGFFQNATDTVVDLFNGGGKNETDEEGVEESTSAGGAGRTLHVLCQIVVASVVVVVII